MVAAATNNIIMVLASLTFMVPLSISSAVAVKVGNAFGSRNYEQLEANAKSALFISLCFTVCSAAMFYLFPAAIMRLTSDDSSVINLAGPGAFYCGPYFKLWMELRSPWPAFFEEWKRPLKLP